MLVKMSVRWAPHEGLIGEPRSPCKRALRLFGGGPSAHADDEKTGYGRDEATIGADPCGQRSALPIPIGFRIAAKRPKGYPDGQNRYSSGGMQVDT